MTYLPLVAFFLAVAWMIWRGYTAKREYLRRKPEGEKTAPSARESTAALGTQTRGQGQSTELTAALAGRPSETVIQGFGGQGRR